MMSDVMKLISYTCGTSKNQHNTKGTPEICSLEIYLKSIENPLSYKRTWATRTTSSYLSLSSIQNCTLSPPHQFLQTCQASAFMSPLWTLALPRICVESAKLYQTINWSITSNDLDWCSLLLHHLRHISCKTVKKACLPMHSCKFSRKKVWRVSPSRSFTYLHSLYEKYRKIKKLGIHVSHKHLSFIPCCTSHHVYFLIARFALTSTTSSHSNPPRCTMATPFPNSNPFNCKWQILQAAAGCLQEGSPHPLLDIKTKKVEVRFAPCDMYTNTCHLSTSVLNYPDTPEGKGKLPSGIINQW